MGCLHNSIRCRRSTSPGPITLTCCIAVLSLLLPGSSVSAARQQVTSRRLLQVSATSATPVNINAGTAAQPQPSISSTTQLPAAGSQQQVTAQSGPAVDAFKSIASDALSSLLHKGKKQEAPAPAQPVATIVVPPQQVAAVPTTTSGISLKTDTPVTVASPINVTTPVKQKNVQVASGGGGENFLDTLINLGNLAVNSAAAGGTIAGAVVDFLNTFLPDCPPPIPGAPPIPGCQLLGDVGSLVSRGTGSRQSPSTNVNVNSPSLLGALADAIRPSAAVAGGPRPASPEPAVEDKAAPSSKQTSSQIATSSGKATPSADTATSSP